MTVTAKSSSPRGRKPKSEPKRLFLEDEAYQRFRYTAISGADGYASKEQYLRAAYYSVRPTLEETGRRAA